MENESTKIDPAKMDETEIRELEQSELQGAAGGSFLSGAWDDVKSAGDWVGNEVENHPVASVAVAVGAVTGIDAIAGAVAVAGSDAAAIAGVSGGDLAAGAAAKTAAGVFSGGVVGGIADTFKKAIDDA